MRAILISAIATGCATGAPPATTLVANSHAVLDAFDRGELATVRPILGRSFVHYETEIRDRDHELARLAKRKPGPAQIASRTWSDERTFIGESSATFIGKAREQDAGNEVHGGGVIYEGWYTLGWARESGAWKLVYWSWKLAGTPSASAEWNQIFHNGIGFDHEPNRLLVSVTEHEHPGAALDVAMGQGRNALYLAAHGWNVTGVDVSDEALGQARAQARARSLALDLIDSDIGTFDFGVDRWDLVTLIYAPSAQKRIADIQRAVKRGGLVIYEYFAANAPDDGEDNGAPAPGALANQFVDGWDIVRDEIVDDVPDWGENRAKVQRFIARKK